MAIRGQGRFNVFVTKCLSNLARKDFLDRVSKTEIKYNINEEGILNVRIFSFSGKAYFNEQLFSILQFVKTVASPKEWLIVDDGTYTHEQKQKLEQFPFIKVVTFDFIQNDKFKVLHGFAFKHVWAKIFYAYFCLLDEMAITTIYLEADVLVFEKFNYYLNLFKKYNWYLSDTGPHFDSYFMNLKQVHMFPVNNGFAIYNQRPAIEKVYEYLIDRFKQGNFEYFTPQSAMQIMIEADSKARFLDPRFFVVSCSDHFKIDIDFEPSKIALRHFVGPVRHKMWQYSWKKLLAIS